MGKNKNPKESSQEQEEEIESYDGNNDEEDHPAKYITREQLKQELKNRITSVQGNEKIAFVALYQLYGQQEKLDDQQDKQIKKITQKYRSKTQEVLNKARAIVAGESTQNSLIASSELISVDEKCKQLKNISIPNFWSTVIKNSSFGALIDKQEQPAIESIKNVLVDYVSQTNTVKIQIHFGLNPIFSNSILKASLTQQSNNQIKHTFDTPKYKAEFVKPESGFFNVFSELSEEQSVGFFQYWLNFHHQQIAHALPFYFELREGTFQSKAILEEFEGQQYGDDEQDQDDDQEEEDKIKSNEKSKNNKNSKDTTKKNIQKPECKQQ